VRGVRLRDGRRVVVKAHRPHTPMSFLRAMQRVQSRLAAEGFPCPEPLVLAGGPVVAETLLDAGEAPDARDPAVRRLMATTLAELVERCRDLVGLDDLRQNIMSVSEGPLWPRPHDPRFDLRAPGGEWIDAIAAEAAPLRDAAVGDEVVGHTDWRVEHVRVDGGRVSAVYDWDSLWIVREPMLVGGNAHAFTVDWSRPELAGAYPTPEQALGFATDYEAARGRPFTPAEWRTLRGSLVWTMAYTARCEQSDGPPGGACAFLAAHAADLLADEDGLRSNASAISS
jgi:hypothetical protein